MSWIKISPLLVGLLQAAGLTAYVSTFALSAQAFLTQMKNQHIQPHPVIAMIMFLLAFVISALICGSMIFLYPLYTFTKGKWLEALKILLWSALWLIFFFCSFVAAALIIFVFRV